MGILPGTAMAQSLRSLNKICGYRTERALYDNQVRFISPIKRNNHDQPNYYINMEGVVITMEMSTQEAFDGIQHAFIVND